MFLLLQAERARFNRISVSAVHVSSSTLGENLRYLFPNSADNKGRRYCPTNRELRSNFANAPVLLLLAGTLGFFACFWFVRKIYSVVKVD